MSLPRRNVLEHHARALYINVPIAADAASALTFTSRMTVEEYAGKGWISIVVDDLDMLRPYLLAGWFMPSFLSGWMTKTNLLVRGSVPRHLVPTETSREGEAREEGSAPRPEGTSGDDQCSVAGYQILSLHFEKSIGGAVKVAGARLTQRIPSTKATYAVSCGQSGKAVYSRLEIGEPYEASIKDDAGNTLLYVKGSLAQLTDEAFAAFVVQRPHKFLVQDGGSRLAYSPEDDASGKADFTTRGVMSVKAEELNIERWLSEVLQPEIMQHVDLASAVVFLQPSYMLVDHFNTILEAA